MFYLFQIIKHIFRSIGIIHVLNSTINGNKNNLKFYHIY